MVDSPVAHAIALAVTLWVRNVAQIGYHRIRRMNQALDSENHAFYGLYGKALYKGLAVQISLPFVNRLSGISQGQGVGLPNWLGARRKEPEQDFGELSRAVRDSDTSPL